MGKCPAHKTEDCMVNSNGYCIFCGNLEAPWIQEQRHGYKVKRITGGYEFRKDGKVIVEMDKTKRKKSKKRKMTKIQKRQAEQYRILKGIDKKARLKLRENIKAELGLYKSTVDVGLINNIMRFIKDYLKERDVGG